MGDKTKGELKMLGFENELVRTDVSFIFCFLFAIGGYFWGRYIERKINEDLYGEKNG